MLTLTLFIMSTSVTYFHTEAHLNQWLNQYTMRFDFDIQMHTLNHTHKYVARKIFA